MLKNVQEAKFQKVLLPISRVAVTPADGRRVSFDAFFTHILMHEMVHGLGPHGLERPSGRTTVREQLGAAYPAIEEAKADVVGLFALHRLVDRGVLPKELERSMYATFLASAFRSIRFGVNEAHGRGVALQLNWFLDQGAVVVDKDGRFSVVDGKIRDCGRVALPGDPGHPGQRRRGPGERAPRPDGGGPSAGGEGARAAPVHPGRHRAPLRHRRGAHRPVRPRQIWSAPIAAMRAADASPSPRAVRGPIRPARPKTATSAAFPPRSNE